MTVAFLEDQSVAVAVVRRTDVGSKSMTLVGVGDVLNLYSQDLDLMDTVSVSTNSRIVRLINMDSSSFFFACADGSLGLQVLSSSSGQLGKMEQLASPTGAVCIDADIHRTGHLASVLSPHSTSLIDTQRDSVMGSIPLGQSGSPNGLRIVDNSLLAIGSAVVSLFDLRSPQCKSGIASLVLDAPEARGRIFTSIESDGTGPVMAGDSSGGLWLWDCRNSNSAVTKSTHAHSGAVMGMSLGGGILGSASADGSVSLWTIVNEQAVPVKKKSRKLLLNITSDVGGLRRANVQGTGTPVAISVEDSIVPVGSDRKVVYVTDTGVLVLGSLSDWQ
jgi:WD40 repeat protein